MATLKLIQSHPLPPPSIYQHSHTDTSIIHTNVLVIINLHTHTCTHTGRQVPGDPSHRGKPHPTPLPMLVPPHKNDTITSCCPPPRFPRDRSFMFRFCLCPGPTLGLASPFWCCLFPAAGDTCLALGPGVAPPIHRKFLQDWDTSQDICTPGPAPYIHRVHSCVLSHSITSNSLRPHRLQPASLFSVHGIFLARILEWVSISSSRRPSQPRG